MGKRTIFLLLPLLFLCTPLFADSDADLEPESDVSGDGDEEVLEFDEEFVPDGDDDALEDAENPEASDLEFEQDEEFADGDADDGDADLADEFTDEDLNDDFTDGDSALDPGDEDRSLGVVKDCHTECRCQNTVNAKVTWSSLALGLLLASWIHRRRKRLLSERSKK